MAMKLKISRGWLLAIGFVLIFVCYFVMRVRTYKQSEFTVGVVMNDQQNKPTFAGDIEMNLYYFIGEEEYCVPTYQYPDKENSIVCVRYLPESPEKGSIYTRGDFWFLKMLWLLLQLLVWAAFVLSFFDENDQVIFILSRNKHCKNNPTNSQSHHVIPDSDPAGRK